MDSHGGPHDQINDLQKHITKLHVALKDLVIGIDQERANMGVEGENILVTRAKNVMTDWEDSEFYLER